jgi:hypothetical protein
MAFAIGIFILVIAGTTIISAMVLSLMASGVIEPTTQRSRVNSLFGPRVRGAHRQGFRDMDENAGPASEIGARAAHRSAELGSGLLLLVWFAGNVVVATLAWFLVSFFLK